MDLKLRSKEDVRTLVEKAVSEVKENNTSIALCNTRLGCAKVVMGLEKMHMDYLRFKGKEGVSSTDHQAFFGYKPVHKQLT